MKKIDKQIREMAKKETLFENEMFSDRLYSMAEHLTEQSGEKNERTDVRLHFRKYLPAAAAIFVMALCCVKAAAPYMADYMNENGIRQEKNRMQTNVYEKDKQEEFLEKEAVWDTEHVWQTPQEADDGKYPGQETGQSADGLMSEDEAVLKAAFYLKTMYDISAEHLESSMCEKDGIYEVEFMADNIRYQARIKADTGAFLAVSMDSSEFVYYQDYIKAEKEQLQKKGKQARKTAELLLGNEPAVTGGKIQYKINEQGQVPHGSAVFLFDLDNGDRLRMPYSIAEDSLWGACIEKGGAGVLEQNVREGETRIYLDIR